MSQPLGKNNESSTSQDKSREKTPMPTNRQLTLKTFGENCLLFSNVRLAHTNQVIEMRKRSGGRSFKITIDGAGMVNIAYEADAAFTVGLYNHSRWVTNLYIDPNNLNIGNVGQALPGRVTTMHITQPEARNVYTTFALQNCSDTMLKRLDVRGYGTPWFSVFSHNTNMLMVRPNGDWVAEKLLYMTDQVATQAINNHRRTNGQEVLPSTGTVVARRRQAGVTQSSATQTDRAIEPRNDEPIASATHSVSTQTDEIHARTIALQYHEQQYQLQLDELETNWRLLHEKTGQYKEERAKWMKIEEQLERLTAEASNRQARKAEIEREMSEVIEEEKILGERKKQLLEKIERYEADKHDFEKKVKEDEQVKLALGACEWYAGWPRINFTGQTLNERFTPIRRLVLANGKLTRQP